MLILKRLTDPALKRLYKFILKRVIGRFLLDELDLDQLDVHLRAGQIELYDLALDAAVINAYLEDMPFQVQSGYVGSVKVVISYANLMKESLVVEIDSVDLVMIPTTCSSSTASSDQKSPSSSSTTADAAEMNVSRQPASSHESTDEMSREGLDFVAHWIEQISSKVKVVISNLNVRFEDSQSPCALVIQLNWLQFYDETPAPAHREDAENPKASANHTTNSFENMAQSFSNMDGGILHKGIKFCGVSMKLVANHSEEEKMNERIHPSPKEAEEKYSVMSTTILMNHPTQHCYIQLQTDQYSLTNNSFIPRWDIDIFLHSIQWQLEPQHLDQLLQLANAFSPKEDIPLLETRQTNSYHKNTSIIRTSTADTSDGPGATTTIGNYSIPNSSSITNVSTADEFDLTSDDIGRIETILEEYRVAKSKMSQSMMTSSFASAHSHYPGSSFTSAAVAGDFTEVESIECDGLSDIDEDEFFECEMQSDSAMKSSMRINQTMYMSARSGTKLKGDGSGLMRSPPSSRCRVKVHILEWKVILLYNNQKNRATESASDDDEDDDEFEDTFTTTSHTSKRQQGEEKIEGDEKDNIYDQFPKCQNMERLIFHFKGMIFSYNILGEHGVGTCSVGFMWIYEKLKKQQTVYSRELVEHSILDFNSSLSSSLSKQPVVQIHIRQNNAFEQEFSLDCTPFVLDWDMSLLKRLTHFSNCFLSSETSSHPQQHSQIKKETKITKKKKTILCLSTDRCTLAVRFPLVQSDVIRFGRSSEFGLCEDKLLFQFEKFYFQYPPSVESPGIKLQFQHGQLILEHYSNPRVPESVQQYSFLHFLCHSEGDRVIDSCEIHFEAQLPSDEEIQESNLSNPSHDNFEPVINGNLDSPPTASNMNSQESFKSGPNENEWFADIENGLRIEKTAMKASEMKLCCVFPEILMDCSKDVFDRLNLLVDALLALYAVPFVDEFDEISGPSFLYFQLTAWKGRIVMKEIATASENQKSKSENKSKSELFGIDLAFTGLRFCQISQWLNQRMSRVHLSADDVTLFESFSTPTRDNPSPHPHTIIPVLYRTPWGSRKSFKSKKYPALYIMMEISDKASLMRDTSVSINFNDLTLRYRVESSWLFQMMDLILTEYPNPVIPIDSIEMTVAEVEALHSATTESIDTDMIQTLPMEQRCTFTKIFMNCYCSVIDYAPTDLNTRGVLVLGLIQVSSNLVTGAMMQGYKFVVHDMEFYLTNTSTMYEKENSLLCGRQVLFDTTQCRIHDSFHSKSSSTMQAKDFHRSPFLFNSSSSSSSSAKKLFFSMQEFLESEGFILIGTLDFGDIFLRSYDSNSSSAPSGDSDNDQSQLKEEEPNSSKQTLPDLSVECTLGIANVYTCCDSSITLIDLLTQWWNSFSPEPSPSSVDTRAYVGLDKMKDLNPPSLSILSSSPVNTESMAKDKTRPRKPLSIFDQIEENAFDTSAVNGGIRTTLGRVPTDSEARLRRTQFSTPLSSTSTSSSSASTTVAHVPAARRIIEAPPQGYIPPPMPKMDVSQFLIEDYYTFGTTSSSTTFPVAPNHPALSIKDNREEVKEQNAQWISSEKDTLPAMSFEAIVDVDDDGKGGDHGIIKAPMIHHEVSQHLRNIENRDDGFVDEEHELPPFSPENTTNWWSFQAKEENLELSDVHLKDDLADEQEQHQGKEEYPNMSMSFYGAGEDEGTEVELDCNLHSKLSDFLELGNEFTIENKIPATAHTDNGQLSQQPNSSALLFHHQEQDVESISNEVLEDGEEQKAMWLSDGENSTTTDGRDPLKIYPHHIEVPLSGSAAALSFGEKETQFALKSIMGDQQHQPQLIRHILLRDFTLQWRLFGGNDWHSRDNTTSSSGHENNSHKYKSAQYEQEQRKMEKSSGASSTQAIPIPRRKKKEQLLDALLDNYVPKGESFAGPKSMPTNLYTSSSRSIADADMGGVKIKQQSNSPPIRHSFTKRSGRRTEQMIELSLRSIQVRIDNFNEPSRTTASHSTTTISHESLASSTFLTIRDFEILDYISTSHIRKLLCFWKSDLSHPREAGTRMATLHLMAIRPGSGLCEEHRMRAKFLPLRINLDQDVLDFLKVFFAPTSTDADTAAAAAAAQEQEDVTLRFNSPNHRVAETSEDLTIGAWFFQSCDIRSCKIKIDYRPQRVNYKALREGDYLEVINLFVLEDMELGLRQVSLSGVDGWPAVAEAVLVSYVSDISRHQVHKCIASVSMPPLRSLANIGSGAADLILLPMEQYEKDRRLIKGIRRGAKSFIKTMTLETLTTASKVARGTQVMLEQVDDVVRLPSSSKSSHRNNHPHAQQYPHSHRRRHSGQHHHNSRSPNHKGSRNYHQNQYRLQPPADAKEGIAQAYSSMSREFSSAVKTIIAVPMVEYQKTGPQGYVKSVIRAVPVAVLRPMIGMSEAVSRTLIGLRNEVDPEKREDLENKFKDNDHAL